ncbi:hypothetical protein D3D02_16990 [Halobellus sp. Atlit-38R]|uniref:hypothetical protein n=1 Tax=Halobellus sp. Atlit-38R TaxID=2282131 RepID=UPI000EF1AF5E|nr:hypothetical protein [Halobellus sp. Atlit-38R]RLM83698.1 hypothetical protein D3D02_16990 [Halobellus sp. Atlit-38R]
MAAQNSRTVFDIVRDTYQRKVIEVGGDGTIGNSLPADLVDDLDISAGDDVVIKESEEQDGVLELHFE